MSLTASQNIPAPLLAQVESILYAAGEPASITAIATALDAPGICFHPSVNQAARTQVRNELGFLSRQLERLKLIRVVHWSKHRKGLSCGVERMQVEENVMRGE